LHQMRCCQAALCAVWIALSACALASAKLGSGPHSKHPEDVLLTITADARLKTNPAGVHLQVHIFRASTLLSDAAVYILNVVGELINFHSGDLALHPPTPTARARAHARTQSHTITHTHTHTHTHVHTQPSPRMTLRTAS